MGGTSVLWIGGRFGKFVLEGPDGTLWKIGKQLSEQTIRLDPWTESNYNTSETQAVYHCRQIQGPSVGTRAIVKVRMQ